MNDRDVCEGLVRCERAIQRFGVSRRVFRRSEHDVVNGQMLQHQHDPLAISAVGQNRDLAVGWHARGENGLDAERAAALQEDSFPAGFPGKPGNFEKLVPNPFDLRVELGMPGAGIVQHRLFDRKARRQRAGSKQQFVTCRG